MNKTIKKISIIISILFLILIIGLSNDSYAVTRPDNLTDAESHEFLTKGKNKNATKPNGQVTIKPNSDGNWKDISTVWVDQSEYGSYYTLTLNQKNVLCVQHGENIDNGNGEYYGWYKASETYAVKNQELAYILYSAANYADEDATSKTWKSNYQQMLWAYLADNEDSDDEDIKRLLAGINISDVSYKYNEIINGENISYKDYVKKINNFNPKVKLKRINDSKVQVKVSGCDGRYSYYTKEKKIDEGKWGSKSTGEASRFEVNVSSDKNFSVKIEDSIKKYYVEYKILTRDNSQKILVVTYTAKQTVEGSSQKELESTSEPNVSIQKYIVAVNNKVVNQDGTVTNTTYDNNVSNNIPQNNRGTSATTQRKAMLTKESESNKAFTRDICPEYSGDEIKDVYKQNNPVQIELGNYVTYKIIVYNNSKTTANNVDVYDRIPFYKDSAGNKQPCGEIVGTYTKDGADSGDAPDRVSLAKVNDGKPTYKWTISELNEGYTYFLMTVRYDHTTSSVLENSAWIESVGNGNENEDEFRKIDRDYVELKTDVSLQKFISHVNGTQIKPERWNFRAYSNGTNYGVADDICNVNNGSKRNEVTNKSYYKYNDPVEIELGSKVTYKIEVYNNSNIKAKNVVIKDTIPANAEVVKITMGNNNYEMKDEWQHSGREYKYTFSLKANTWVCFYVTMEFKTGNVGTIYTNTVQIEKVGNGNTTTRRIVDYDYVVIKNYKVSLEKYISKVTNKDGGDVSNYTDREWKRHNESLAAGDINRNNAKREDPIELEIGDKVTYTIKLTNEGDTPVRINQIYDSFGYIGGNDLSIKNTDGSKNVGLKYSSISASSGITATWDNSTYGENNIRDRYDRHLINISGNNLIASKKSIYIYVTFDIDIPTTYNNENRTLFNKAGIVLGGLQNKFGVKVNDSDGENNNYDMDWVKTKKYSVKLEKFVYQVHDANNKNVDLIPNSERLGHPIYNQDGFNKEENPVLVSKDNTVTYKIILTNTGDNTTNFGRIRRITVVDKLPSYLKFKSASSNVEYDSDRQEITWSGDLNLKDSVEFTLTYEILDTAVQGLKIENKAEISRLTNKNDKIVEDSTPKDNIDKDWIKIKVTSVAIEKFVTKVTSLNDTIEYDQENGVYKARQGVRFNEHYKEEYANLGPTNNEFKKNNYVEVEPGDIVTFKIKLQNTGELPVKIDQFYDSYSDFWSERDYRYGTGLEYIDGSIKNISQNSKISKISIDFSKEYNKGADRTEFRRYLIDVEWNDYLAPNAEEEIEIQFKVLSPIRGTALLWNKVGIVKITDIYNRNFTWHIGEDYMEHNDNTKEGDYDGPNNNYDMDFLEVQEYKVSLQKVVDSVTGSNVTVGNRWDSWESHANTCTCAQNNNVCDSTSEICSICDGISWYNKGCICALYSEDCIDDNKDSKCDNCHHDIKFANIKDDKGNKKIAYEHKDEQVNAEMRYAKHNNPITVANGNLVRYAIRVKNDGDTKVKITKILDKLPSGVELQYVEKVLSDETKMMLNKNTTINHSDINKEDNLPLGEYIYDEKANELYIFPQHEDNLLEPQQSDMYYVTVKVTETNMSIDVMRNYAHIEWIRNKNEYIDTQDVTTADNDDADYIQMKDIEISGIVWNDKAFDKGGNNYNGSYDYNDDYKESLLSGVTVKLYRLSDDGQTSTLVAQDVTDGDGKYTFTNDDIARFNVITHKCEQYIKGPYKCIEEKYTGTTTHGANYWTGTYYSYYVVFEYDGITYTSTVYADFGDNAKDTALTSNAREKLEENGVYEGRVEQSRIEFNNKYETINSNGAVSGSDTINLIYNTKNEEEYIPQSIYNHEATSDIVNMQSSTKKIGLSKDSQLEEKLQHINMGLRGREIFDLELISDVEQVEITVNKQKGVYKHQNVVSIKKSDLLEVKEDTANVEPGEVRKIDSFTDKVAGVEEKEQNIRSTDLNPASTVSGSSNPYSQDDGVQSIYVIYKISVTNASNTEGKVTKITNYYDKKYEFIGAYDNFADAESRTTDKLDIEQHVTENESYNYITINTGWDWMTQSNNVDETSIYILYKLVPNQEGRYYTIPEGGLATYNMAEITEYQTKSYAAGSIEEKEKEFTRGLIDKDSEPGSANKEKVRTKTSGEETPKVYESQTTVEYYFNNSNNLDELKYEDDTYATPTLLFKEDNSQRKITGTVFEDLTKVYSDTKIKTGNGVLEDGEVGVYGARVQLIEQVEGDPVRFEVTTNTEGKFEFSGFLPGNYIIKYYYGDTEKTVLINNSAKPDGTKVNAESYNGEDFQSTNNSYYIDEYTQILNRTPNYWYVYNENEGISTAIDDTTRRIKVSENVTKFIDEQMQLLNNIRNGRQDVTLSYEDGGESKTIALGSIIESDIENSMNIIPNTYMFAYTDPMILTVEKTELTMDKEGNVTGTSQRTNFGPYVVENMNFGIAEVPVTIVDLQKHVSEFKIEDSTGKNILASLKKDDEDWEITGNVIVAGNYIDVQIENEKLQGARLEVKYIISVDMDIEVNFDRTTCTVPKITGVVDFVNNNLSYNKNLGNNDLYWEVTTFQEVQKELAKQKIHDNVTEPKGTIDPTGTKYSTILMAKSGSDENNGNPLLGATEELRTVEITLEKVLSSTELTIDEIITSTVDTSEYNNIVEIIGFKYGSSLEDLEESPEENPDGGNPEGNPDEGNPEENPEGENPGGNPGGENPGDEENPPMRDRVRNEDGEAFIPGVDNDYAISETIVEHPPTGTTQIDTIYYVVAVIALVVLAVGVYGIKKFVIKK